MNIYYLKRLRKKVRKNHAIVKQPGPIFFVRYYVETTDEWKNYRVCLSYKEALEMYQKSVVDWVLSEKRRIKEGASRRIL